MSQLDPEDSRLDSIQTGVDPDGVIVVPHLHAMVGNAPDQCSQFIIVSQECTTVTVASEIL